MDDFNCQSDRLLDTPKDPTKSQQEKNNAIVDLTIAVGKLPPGPAKSDAVKGVQNYDIAKTPAQKAAAISQIQTALNQIQSAPGSTTTVVVVGGGGNMPVVSGPEEEPAAPGGSVYPPSYSQPARLAATSPEPEAGACGVVKEKLAEIIELMAKLKEMKATLSAGETMSPEMLLLFGNISEKLKAVREFARDCGEEIPRMMTELEEILVRLQAS